MRLAAGKDRHQRHAERRGQMQQPGIDADDELRAGDEPRDLIERRALRHARARQRGGDLFAARALVRVPQGSTISTPRAAI